MTLDGNYAAVARTFVDARRNSEIVADYPGAMPQSLAEAYDIQDSAIGLAGTAIGGWKVGRVPDGLIETYGANRLVGPIFRDTILQAPADEACTVPVLPGFAAIEAELLLRIGAVPPANVDIHAIADYVDEVRFGLEIASSPFPGINDFGPAVTVSDFGNNFGLVLGPKIDDWQRRNLLDAPVRLALDGETIGTGKLSNMLDGPFGAAAFLANLLALRGIALTPGTWISTGAITGVHKVEPGQSATAVFDQAFAVSCFTRLFTPVSQALRGESV